MEESVASKRRERWRRAEDPLRPLKIESVWTVRLKDGSARRKRTRLICASTLASVVQANRMRGTKTTSRAAEARKQAWWRVLSIEKCTSRRGRGGTLSRSPSIQLPTADPRWIRVLCGAVHHARLIHRTERMARTVGVVRCFHSGRCGACRLLRCFCRLLRCFCSTARGAARMMT